MDQQLLSLDRHDRTPYNANEAAVALATELRHVKRTLSRWEKINAPTLLKLELARVAAVAWRAARDLLLVAENKRRKK